MMVEELKGALEEFKGEVIETVKIVTKEEVKRILEEEKIGKIEKAPEYSEGEKKDIAQFFKALVSKDFVALKALSEGVDTAGGYLVPEEFKAQVLDIAKDVGYVRKYGTVLTLNKDTMNIPKLSSKPSVSWVSEGGQISEGEPTFEQVQLVVKKAGIIVPVTTELFEDSDTDIVKLLAKIFAEAFAEGEDTQGFAGDGTVFTGVLNASDVNTVTMDTGKTSFADITADDLINLISAVPSKVAGKGYFVMHRSVLAKIKTLKDGNGSYLFNPTDKTIWGYPVITIDVMPSMADSAADKAFIIFGDLSYLYLGDRKKMSVALADQATVGSNNLFEKDMIAVKATERVAITVAMPEAFAVLKTAAS